MVQIVKKEWHQVTSSFKLEIDEALLSEIYPDMSDEELVQLLVDLESGEAILDYIVTNAMDNDIELDWDHDDDDWWTHRKGGYEVTFEINKG